MGLDVLPILPYSNQMSGIHLLEGFSQWRPGKIVHRVIVGNMDPGILVDGTQLVWQ